MIIGQFVKKGKMMDTNITSDDLALLTKWDTPTICNALEEIIPARRGYGFTTTHFFSLDSALPPICGFARTATIRAAGPSPETSEQMVAKRAAYYEYVAAVPAPTIVVIQDIDSPPGVGAFWGEVQTNIHKGLGVLGAVTNGSFRDVPDSAPAFNLIGGKIGPSHAFVHIVDIDCQVTVFGLTAKTNDIIHADQHGAVLIPPAAVKQIPAVVDLISRREEIILEAAKSADFTVAKLKTTMGQIKDIH